MNRLVDELFDAGLLQFGMFENDVPYALRLDMLPSYPNILYLMGNILSEVVLETNCNRLVCKRDALVISVATGLHSKIPLVYEYERTNNPALDFIGAYDVGHPTVWIQYQSYEDEQFNKRCQSVGLMVTNEIVVFSESYAKALIYMPAVVEYLAKQQKISSVQAKNIIKWLENKNHP